MKKKKKKEKKGEKKIIFPLLLLHAWVQVPELAVGQQGQLPPCARIRSSSDPTRFAGHRVRCHC